jgi:Prolyl oligopeptidase, N-terminal beta-propeller domain
MLVRVLLRPRVVTQLSSLSGRIPYQYSLFPSLRIMPLTTSSWTPHCYPPTRRSDHFDLYQSEARGEVKVPDPYEWFEKDGEEREKWLVAQEALARDFLDLHPDRSRLEEEIRASTNYEKVSFLGIVYVWRDCL